MTGPTDLDLVWVEDLCNCLSYEDEEDGEGFVGFEKKAIITYPFRPVKEYFGAGTNSHVKKTKKSKTKCADVVLSV